MELWKDNLLRNEQLLDQIWEMSVEYIENPKHKDLFLQTFMRVCAAKGDDVFFDDLEVFDSDPPEFVSMTLSAAGTPEIAVEMGCGPGHVHLHADGTGHRSNPAVNGGC